MSDTNRTPLSPAAQAVLDAAHEAWVTRDDPGSIAAAALRAAVDQVVPVWDKPGSEYVHVMGEWQEGQRIRLELLAIAAELEGRP